MRRMRGAGRVVQKPRLVGRQCVLHPHPGDRLIGEIDVEDVIRLAHIRFNRRHVFVQRRVPLVAVAAEEAVKVLKAETVRPQVERPCLARHPVRHIVHLAKPRGVVAVLLENGPDRTSTLWHQRIVAGIAGCELGNVAAGNRMVVAPGDQSSPRRRAQRRRVILVVAKASVRHMLEVWSLDWAAKGAACSEAHVVCQDQQHVWCARRSLNTLWKIRDRPL